jgi:drug/metabolite transporter superfamily protein YnfA
VSQGTVYLVIFLLAAVAGIGGMFLYGWKRRKDKMPKVAPLPKDDDWDN